MKVRRPLQVKRPILLPWALALGRQGFAHWGGCGPNPTQLPRSGKGLSEKQRNLSTRICHFWQHITALRGNATTLGLHWSTNFLLKLAREDSLYYIQIWIVSCRILFLPTARRILFTAPGAS